MFVFQDGQGTSAVRSGNGKGSSSEEGFGLAPMAAKATPASGQRIAIAVVARPRSQVGCGPGGVSWACAVEKLTQWDAFVGGGPKVSHQLRVLQLRSNGEREQLLKSRPDGREAWRWCLHCFAGWPQGAGLFILSADLIPSLCCPVV